MALGRMERILILAKTYPSPSAQYVETSCVAGISQDGSMRRLYPVPFRMIEEGRQFKKQTDGPQTQANTRRIFPLFDDHLDEDLKSELPLTRIFHHFLPDALSGTLVWQITALASAQTCSQGIS